MIDAYKSWKIIDDIVLTDIKLNRLNESRTTNKIPNHEYLRVLYLLQVLLVLRVGLYQTLYS